MIPESETLEAGFCSAVRRGAILIKKKKRLAIFKTPRRSVEGTLLKNEIKFYKELLPTYNKVNGLFFSGKKFCPTLFDSATVNWRDSRLVIEDLRSYRTKEFLQLTELYSVLRQLAIFHAIGFLLKNDLPRNRSSQRLRGSSSWCTFIHGDCWARNLMFCGRNRMKFIDFGFYDYNHCLVDLVYLLYTSTQTSAVNKVCEYYKNQLQLNLHKLGLQLDFNNFAVELRKTAIRIYPLATTVIGIVRKAAARREQLCYAQHVLEQLRDGSKELDNTL